MKEIALKKQPACLYCGMSMDETGNLMYRWYMCPRCFAGSPQKRIERFTHDSDEEAVRAAQEKAYKAAEFLVRPGNRVLTLGEAQGLSSTDGGDGYVYLEEAAKGHFACIAHIAPIDCQSESVMVNTFFERFPLNAAAYGKKWRCWAIKPTMEQMAGTPWEAAK